MAKEKKAQTIDKLQESFAKCNIGILTDYRGLATPDMVAIRSKLREKGSQFKVVKDTLARIAAEKAGKGDSAKLFEGPVAVAFGFDDITATAKVLAEYIQTSKVNLKIKGGFLANRILTMADVMTLSTLPSREVLIARALGGMKSPITSLVICLAAPIRGIMGVLQARIKQMEEQNVQK
ncbi:MAG: 50S ribosomal protein L10 [Chloroflexota bacterium]